MNVVVTEYNDKWNEMFIEESQQIKKIFADEVIDIHHIGSTSVPGLKAKPIIDIMPVVKDIEKMDSFNEQMISLGYECMGELGMKGRRYFRKGGDHRTHQVHVFQADNKEDINRHLAVRDYLRTHSEDVKQYGDLKENLAKHFPKDIAAYMDGKDEFVKELERKALQWYRNSYRLLEIEFEYNGQKQAITPILLQDECETILIDCGYPNFMPLLEEAFSRNGVTLDSITKLIVTHHDMDHIGSLAALKRAYPHIEIIAHELEAPYIKGTRKSLRLEQAESTLDVLPAEAKPYAEQFIRFLQSIEPVAVDRTVSDRERLPWCGGIEIIHTPGHMPGHISLYLPASKTLIAADAVVIEEGKLAIANPQHTLDLDEALRSVHRLLEYDMEQIICYHGGLFHGDVKQSLRQLLAK
jgi:GrpB-like predicted nucleotidyltransferase (UPF0157 family)/glyoxylase-like metal-dependent hydrolase (beta-lactamase superfamily II)